MMALWIGVENTDLPPFIDRRNPLVCGIFWPIFFLALLVVALINAVSRPHSKGLHR